MVNTIHKHVLQSEVNEIVTYEGVRFLHVDNQREQITVWTEVDTEAPKIIQAVYVVGTGWTVPVHAEYVGSAVFAQGEFVYHIYTGPTNPYKEITHGSA